MTTTYDVIDVRQITRFTPAGREVPYYDIHISTEHNATGCIRIAQADYTPELVKEKLEAFADELEMPFKLSETK